VEALYYMGVVNMALRRPEQAVAYLTRAQAKSPQDNSIAFQLALAYFAQQQYDRAEPLFERVFKADPTIDGLGYYVGFIRYRKKDYRGALEAFRRGRTTDPQLQQLTKFYTGLSLAVLGLPAQASAEVEQALKLAPGSPLTGPAERLRDTIKTAAQAGRQLSASVSLGFLYDDNVIVRPGPNSHEPLVPALRTQKEDSHGETANARFDYTWLRGPLFGWVPRDGDNYTLGILHLLRFAGDKHLVKAGYQVDWEDAQGRNYRYLGHRFLAGVQYTLDLPAALRTSWNPVPQLRLSYDFDVHVRDYGNKNSLLPTPDPGSKWRQDEEYNNTVRAEAPFEGPRILGEPTRMSLALAYQNTVANSNIAVFNYTRNVYS